jgi:hypothetical protein
LGKLYLLANSGIYLYIDGAIEKIQNDILDYGGFLRFSSSRDSLWVFGQKKIVQYDGSLWRECTTVISDDISDTPVLGFFNDDVLTAGSDYLED